MEPTAQAMDAELQVAVSLAADLTALLAVEAQVVRVHQFYQHVEVIALLETVWQLADVRLAVEPTAQPAAVQPIAK